jgi:hypothetical protein
MIGHLSTGRMVELGVAVLLLAAGLYFYRMRANSDSYGSQGAVILFVIGAIMGTHALGGFDYRPSKAEAEMMKERAR